jgi:inhibitor of KinA sporulation pathway (predicted exonuclease)
MEKYYLVIDLEATCDENHAIPREETEIIEIGAVLCDGETLRPTAEFQTFVKPLRHPKLTPFCTKLTSIQQSDVESAPSFNAAVQKLGAWLRETNALGQVLFCSWGDYDKNQLARQERHAGIRLPLGKGHLNLKEAFRKFSRDDRKVGTGQALRADRSGEGAFSRALRELRRETRARSDAAQLSRDQPVAGELGLRLRDRGSHVPRLPQAPAVRARLAAGSRRARLS